MPKEDTVPPRGAVAPEHTWNAESVFETPAAWEAALNAMLARLPSLGALPDKVGPGPAQLLEVMQAVEAVVRSALRVYAYASISHQVDTSDQAAAARFGQAQGMFGQVMAGIAFLDPALLAVGQARLSEWLQAEPRLAIYQHYVDDLFRRQAHVRSAEVEELLGLASDAFGGSAFTAGMLTNADFKFEPATASDGSRLPLTQGTLDKLLSSGDREARRTAWENYADVYLAHKNTLASNLATSIKQNIFQMRARRHESSLAASLFENNIPGEVFHNLIDTFRRNLPTWHRYWEIRRRALGVEALQPYDVWAPLASHRPAVPYRQAVEWICEGLAPLGAEYVETVRRGCLEQRWVDVYPNQGKTEGAFSSGVPGTHPFIVMSYDDEIFSLSTLAHELGHSMHSYLTWQHQPFFYSNYSLFAAEVASNFHQAMVRADLLQKHTDPDFQISVLEEAFSNFHRYFFIMPTLARFELEVHQRVERGQGLTADGLIDLMADLFGEGYGGRVAVDRPRVGITWATFGHLYMDYYVYQYATGISGAHALARRILDGVPGAAEAYLGFLKAGSSDYPLEALRRAGVDLASPEPVEAAFQTLAGMVDRLEQLLTR